MCAVDVDLEGIVVDLSIGIESVFEVEVDAVIRRVVVRGSDVLRVDIDGSDVVRGDWSTIDVDGELSSKTVEFGSCLGLSEGFTEVNGDDIALS